MGFNRANDDSPLPKLNDDTPGPKQEFFAPGAFLAQAYTRTNANSHSVKVNRHTWYIRQDILSREVFGKASSMQQIIHDFRMQGNQRKVAENVAIMVEEIINIRIFLKPGDARFESDGIHSAKDGTSKRNRLRHILHRCLDKCSRWNLYQLPADRPGFQLSLQVIHFLFRIHLLLSPWRGNGMQISDIDLVLQPAKGHAKQLACFFVHIKVLIHPGKSLQPFVLSYLITASYAIYMIFSVFPLTVAPPSGKLMEDNLCKLYELYDL